MSLGPRVDAIVLYHSREVSARALMGALAERDVNVWDWGGVMEGRTFFQQEFPPVRGAFETNLHLEDAKAVVVILGSAGWDEPHRRLTLEAQKIGKRIVLVLLGDPPADAISDAGGLFRTHRYIDLREFSAQSLDALAATIEGEQLQDVADLDEDEHLSTLLQEGSQQEAAPNGNSVRVRQFDKILGTLVDGDESERFRVLNAVRDSKRLDQGALSARLRIAIEEYGPYSTKRSQGDIPSIRSWLLSTLIWVDAEDLGNRVVILGHLDHSRPEPSKDVRFWILAGLYQCKATYLEKAIAVALADPAEEVSLLAWSIRDPHSRDLHVRMLGQLDASTFDPVWQVLRVLRIVAVPEVVKQVCGQLFKTPQGRQIGYDALYALCHPAMASHAVPELMKTPGLDGLISLVVQVCRDSNPLAIRNFSRLLAAFPVDALQAGLTSASLDRANTEIVRTLRTTVMRLLRERVREIAIANYANDTIDVSKDYLDIGEDVRTLTAVMVAREVKPPLAIGLFGDWGSGKSYFMKSMQESIRDLCRGVNHPPNSRFCAHIVSIEFNAWNYVDSNLWASLVSHILQKLEDHVMPEASEEEQLAKADAKVASAKTVVEEVEREKRKEVGVLSERQARLLDLKRSRLEKEVRLKELRFADFAELLGSDEDLKHAIDDLGLRAAPETAVKLLDVLREADTIRGRTWAVITDLFGGRNRVVLGVLTAAILAAPIALPWLATSVHLNDVLAKLGVILTEITLFLTGAAGLIGKVKAYLAKLDAAKARAERIVAQKSAKPTEEESDLEREIAALKSQEIETETRLASATARVVELQERLDALKNGFSLAKFLSNRNQSEDYQKHLGLISTIRKDFELLEMRLRQAVGQSGVPVDRILLYIDDLDRCPVDKVMDVLQAIHLLLAYPLFVVVVGVDPRWLLHSLEMKFSAFQAGTNDRLGEAEWRTTPQNYLEKIFQIPFTLRPMNREGYENLMGALLSQSVKPVQNAKLAGSQDEIATPVQKRGVEEGGGILEESLKSEPPGDHAIGKQVERSPGDDSSLPPFEISDDALIIQKWEANFADRLFGLIPNPRAAKRFANIYRMLKAPIQREKLAAFEGTEGMPGEFQVPMLLLAVLIGNPKVATGLFVQLFEAAAKGLDLLAALRPLEKYFGQVSSDSQFPLEPELFTYWIPRVSRFSFEAGRNILPMAEANEQEEEESPQEAGAELTAVA